MLAPYQNFANPKQPPSLCNQKPQNNLLQLNYILTTITNSFTIQLHQRSHWYKQERLITNFEQEHKYIIINTGSKYNPSPTPSLASNNPKQKLFDNKSIMC
jgi:hypothetical protein